jgi:hypothetical protein
MVQSGSEMGKEENDLKKRSREGSKQVRSIALEQNRAQCVVCARAVSVCIGSLRLNKRECVRMQARVCD